MRPTAGQPSATSTPVGSSACSSVGPPSGLSTRSSPSRASTRSRRPARPPPSLSEAPPAPPHRRHGAAPGDGAQGGYQPAVQQDRRSRAADEVSQLRQSLAGLLA